MEKVLMLILFFSSIFHNLSAQRGVVSDSNYTYEVFYGDSIGCKRIYQYILEGRPHQQLVKIYAKSHELIYEGDELDTSKYDIYMVGYQPSNKEYIIRKFYNGEPSYSYCEQKIYLAEYTQRKKNQTITTTWYAPNQQRSWYKEHRKKKQSKAKKWAKNGQLITCLSKKDYKRHGWMKVWSDEGQLLYKIKFDEGYILKYYRYVDGKKEPGVNYYLKMEKETISSLVPKEDITLFYPIRSQCRDICYPPSKMQLERVEEDE